MLRLITKGNVSIKSMDSLATTFIRCMSVEQNPRFDEQRKPFKERLNVTLCGRVNQPPVQLENGSTVVPIITKNDDNEFTAKHRVISSMPALKNMFNSLTEGQRVYVSGFIGYSEFRTPEGYRRHSGWIMPNDFFLCEGNEEFASDINEVKLFGYVQFTPKNSDNATFLEVSTNFFDRKEQIVKRRLHQVLIKDNDKMRQQASALETGTGIFIHGSLKTEHARTQDEKLRAMYYIIPKKLIVSQKTAANFNADES